MALLIILDHLLVLTICIHHLSHLLSLCGITYQTVLKLLLSSYLRLPYHISKYCYLCSLCPFFDMNFIIEKQFSPYYPTNSCANYCGQHLWGVICVRFNMHNMPSCISTIYHHTCTTCHISAFAVCQHAYTISESR